MSCVLYFLTYLRKLVSLFIFKRNRILLIYWIKFAFGYFAVIYARIKVDFFCRDYFLYNLFMCSHIDIYVLKFLYKKLHTWRSGAGRSNTQNRQDRFPTSLSHMTSSEMIHKSHIPDLILE